MGGKTTICHSTASLSQELQLQQLTVTAPTADYFSTSNISHQPHLASKKFPRTWPGLLAGQTMPHPTAVQFRAQSKGQTGSDLDSSADPTLLGKEPRRNLVPDQLERTLPPTCKDHTLPAPGLSITPTTTEKAFSLL